MSHLGAFGNLKEAASRPGPAAYALPSTLHELGTVFSQGKRTFSEDNMKEIAARPGPASYELPSTLHALGTVFSHGARTTTEDNIKEKAYMDSIDKEAKYQAKLAQNALSPSKSDANLDALDKLLLQAAEGKKRQPPPIGFTHSTMGHPRYVRVNYSATSDAMMGRGIAPQATRSRSMTNILNPPHAVRDWRTLMYEGASVYKRAGPPRDHSGVWFR